MPVNSVQALPCACRLSAFLCPMWQRPVSSAMATLRARNLFLLENSSLKFDGSGVERRCKHDIFQSRYRLGVFDHLHNELRKDSTKFFWVLQNVAFSIWLYRAGYWQHISHSSTNFQKTISVEERLFVTLRQVQHATHLTRFIQFRNGASLVPWKTAKFINTQIHW